MKLEIFPGVPLNTCGLATFVLASLPPPTLCAANKTWSCACNVTINTSRMQHEDGLRI